MLKGNFYGEGFGKDFKGSKGIKGIKELPGKRGTAAAETAPRQ